MATIGQIRGMLLEEALLHLLRHTGYRPVLHTNDDPTLELASNGLNVKGRGAKHQIDAIADCILYPPFSHPQRLLVEAKCMSTRTGLPVVRNALGVLKDVSEFWVSCGGVTPTRRYHYQYAMFSASGYTANAEEYAFAQDIYLIPLAHSEFLNPIIESIQDISAEDFAEEAANKIDVRIKSLRDFVRNLLGGEAREPDLFDGHAVILAEEKLTSYADKCHQIDTALLAMLGGSFPVFLVPAPGVQIRDLRHPIIDVRIRYDNKRWYLEKRDGSELFSFDLPKQLFEMYAEGGRLTPRRALDMKRDRMSEFQALYSPEGDPIRLLSFRLDHEWLQNVLEYLQD